MGFDIYSAADSPQPQSFIFTAPLRNPRMQCCSNDSHLGGDHGGVRLLVVGQQMHELSVRMDAFSAFFTRLDKLPLLCTILCQRQLNRKSNEVIKLESSHSASDSQLPSLLEIHSQHIQRGKAESRK